MATLWIVLITLLVLLLLWLFAVIEFNGNDAENFPETEPYAGQ